MSVFDEGWAEDRRSDNDLYLGAPGWDYPEEPEGDEWNDTDDES